jgi:hypothetical protein
MTKSGRDYVTFAFEIVVDLLKAAEGASEVARYAGLFGNNQ